MTADPADLERDWAGRSNADWAAAGFAAALAVFRRAAADVPAYRDFLGRHGIEPAAVRTPADFAAVPVTDKANYLDHYDFADLLWHGNAAGTAVIHASSGTTGVASYWACSAQELTEAAALYELVLTRGLGLNPARTLLVVCFGMGTWVAGSYTTAAAQLIHRRGLPLTTVTPGFNKDEALTLVRRLGPHFDQVVIAGIPSFVKDFLDAWRRGHHTDRRLGRPARGRVAAAQQRIRPHLAGIWPAGAAGDRAALLRRPRALPCDGGAQGELTRRPSCGPVR